MSQEEVIIFNKVSPEEYLFLAQRAIKYALISVAFTYNRMDKNNLSERINNITKGKIAEFLFYHYCKQNEIQVVSDACSTPFWKPDNRDFLWLGGEWDIKNNFFYCSDSDFKYFDCTLLPALIPNKTHYDQWSKRNDHLIASSRYNAFLFTFMRLHPKDKNFFSINLSDGQIDFILSIVERFNNLSQGRMPFMDAWFFNSLNEKGPSDYISIKYRPELIITGCANPRYWSLFVDIPCDNNTKPYLRNTKIGNWYDHKKNRAISFLNGVLLTKIKNKTCPVSLLPSFQSILRNISAKTD